LAGVAKKVRKVQKSEDGRLTTDGTDIG